MLRSLNTYKGPGDCRSPDELDTTDGTEHEFECACGWIGQEDDLSTRSDDDDDIEPERPCCPKCKSFGVAENQYYFERNTDYDPDFHISDW